MTVGAHIPPEHNYRETLIVQQLLRNVHGIGQNIQILELMQKLNKELKTTFIFSTHDAKIVSMANHVIKIHDGCIDNA